MDHSFIATAYAACEGMQICPEGTVPSTSTTSGSLTGAISAFAADAVSFLLLIAGVLAVFYLVWSGIQYITSGGSPDKIKTARTGIINAVIGIVVILSAYFIIRFAVSLGKATSCGLDGTVQEACK